MKQWVNIMVLLLFLFSVKEARAQQVITKPSQMEKPLVPILSKEYWKTADTK